MDSQCDATFLVPMFFRHIVNRAIAFVKFALEQNVHVFLFRRNYQCIQPIIIRLHACTACGSKFICDHSCIVDDAREKVEEYISASNM